MALPRYLKNKFTAFLSGMTVEEKLLAAMCAGADYGPLVFDVLDTERKTKKKLSYEHVISGFVRARWAYFELRRYRRSDIDEMVRITAELYVGLERLSTGVHIRDMRPVYVPKYFEAKLTEANSARERKDRIDAEHARQIALVRDKVYASRCFPARLRLIIFERDQYRCQICLRAREEISKLGLSLEVDHILAYVDGGKTTYGNGMTLCSECNSAKHHAKGYLSAVESVRVNIRK